MLRLLKQKTKPLMPTSLINNDGSVSDVLALGNNRLLDGIGFL
jgi:hypothetical protein